MLKYRRHTVFDTSSHIIKWNVRLFTWTVSKYLRPSFVLWGPFLCSLANDESRYLHRSYNDKNVTFTFLVFLYGSTLHPTQ